MRRIGAWLPMVALLFVMLIAQGLMIGWTLPDSADGRARGGSVALGWSGIVRDTGPIMERIPAPYVVLTIVGAAALAMIVWSLLVRWTDIDEAI